MKRDIDLKIVDIEDATAEQSQTHTQLNVKIKGIENTKSISMNTSALE